MTSWKGRCWQITILLACSVPPAVLCQFFAEPPCSRHIHMESFRYGKEPSVIRCNRGDRLHLTFSTGDTGHSFFLEEFDIDAKISSTSGEVIQFSPRNPESPPVRVKEVVFTAEHPGWLRWLVSKSQFRCHVWCGPMHAFEQGNLIIEPNTLLHASLGLLLGIPLAGLLGLFPVLKRESALVPEVTPVDGWDVFARMPWLKRLMKQRGFQFAFVTVAMALFYVVLLTALVGTQMAGRNLGTMLLWIVWLFLLVAILTPLGGRIWCLACPLPILGECLQRRALTGVRTGTTGAFRNRFFGLQLAWPKWLSNAWPRTLALLALGTFSAALVANPRISAGVIIALALLPVVMSLIWELRAFCRYLCPINAFLSPYSTAGMLSLRCTEPEVCQNCGVHTCQTGNASGWACPYGLCVAQMNENSDCGLCTECIKSCSFNNITLRLRPFAHEIKIRHTSEAFQVIAMLSLACTYCVVHLGHWPEIRDFVNILDKANWGLFAVFAAILWGITLLVLPAVLFLLAWLGRHLGKSLLETTKVFMASTGALIPFGLLLWIAFVVPMLFVNSTFVAQSLSDPFGWGWDFFGTRNIPWHQLWPRSVPWIQVGCVLVGLALSLRNAWRIWLGLACVPRNALLGMLPISAFLLAFSLWLVFFFAN